MLDGVAETRVDEWIAPRDELNAFSSSYRYLVAIRTRPHGTPRRARAHRTLERLS